MAAHAVYSHPQTTCMSQQETRTLVTVCADIQLSRQDKNMLRHVDPLCVHLCMGYLQTVYSGNTW